jgi:hypothetical protein
VYCVSGGATSGFKEVKGQRIETMYFIVWIKNDRVQRTQETKNENNLHIQDINELDFAD